MSLKNAIKRKLLIMKIKKILLYVVLFLLLVFLIIAGVIGFNNLSTSPIKKVSETQSYQESVKSSTISTSLSEEIPSETTEVRSYENESSTLVSTEESIVPTSASLDFSPIERNAKTVAYGIYYFNTGEYLTNDNNNSLISASVIKVFIMEYIFTKQFDLSSIISGETLENLAYRMITVSDNEATNILIDYLGMENLNAYFLEKGYSNTKLERKMLDTTAQDQGLENYTSLEDTMKFLKNIYAQKDSYPYSKMLNIMLNQQIKTKIPSKLNGSVSVANKTGELVGVENDIGIVFASNPFAIVVLTNGVYNSDALREAIGNITLTAVNKVE